MYETRAARVFCTFRIAVRKSSMVSPLAFADSRFVIVGEIRTIRPRKSDRARISSTSDPKRDSNWAFVSVTWYLSLIPNESTTTAVVPPFSKRFTFAVCVAPFVV